MAYPLTLLVITSPSPIGKDISVMDDTTDLIYKYDIEHESKQYKNFLVFFFVHIYKKDSIILKK